MARYLISEAARLTDVEAHVLRYWEEELELDIPRNELGHRYYTEEHIAIFNHIKEMKAQGFQLKAIKESLARAAAARKEEKETSRQEDQPAGKLLHMPENRAAQDKQENGPAEVREIQAVREAAAAVTPVEDKSLPVSREDKMIEFESIVYDIVTEALRNNNERLGREVSDKVNDKVVKELNYLMRENEDHMEEHFRKLDEALTSKRKRNKGEKEAAATKVTKLPVVSQSKKKHRLFSRKRKTTIY